MTDYMHFDKNNQLILGDNFTSDDSNNYDSEEIYIRDGVKFTSGIYNAGSSDLHAKDREEIVSKKGFKNSQVINKVSGTLHYSVSEEHIERVRIIVQFALSKKNEQQAFITVESDHDGFSQIFINPSDIKGSIEYLDLFLQMMQITMQRAGINFGKHSLTDDIINLFRAV